MHHRYRTYALFYCTIASSHYRFILPLHYCHRIVASSHHHHLAIAPLLHSHRIIASQSSHYRASHYRFSFSRTIWKYKSLMKKRQLYNKQNKDENKLLTCICKGRPKIDKHCSGLSLVLVINLSNVFSLSHNFELVLWIWFNLIFFSYLLKKYYWYSIIEMCGPETILFFLHAWGQYLSIPGICRCMHASIKSIFDYKSYITVLNPNANDISIFVIWWNKTSLRQNSKYTCKETTRRIASHILVSIYSAIVFNQC